MKKWLLTVALITVPLALAQNQKIKPGEWISLVVFEVPGLTSTVRVDDAGIITLPLIGGVHASGLTLEQLKSHLQQELSRYIADPR